MNEQLRAHVTRVGFDLTLTKTQIAALVWLEELRKRRWDSAFIDTPPRGDAHRSMHSYFVPAAAGLIARGLVEHQDISRPIDHWEENGVWHHRWHGWRITPAGRLVVGLLRESGLYDDYAAHLVYRDEDASVTA